MKIIIKTKNIEFTDALDVLINKRMAGLKKFLKILKENSNEVFIEVEVERAKHHKKGDIFLAEAIIAFPGKKLVAKSHGQDVGTIITEVKKELEREIRKYKTKKIELPRRKYRKIKKELS